MCSFVGKTSTVALLPINPVPFATRLSPHPLRGEVRLRSELDRRSGELDKINSLDNKISTELQQLDVKMKQFQEDIANKCAAQGTGSRTAGAMKVLHRLRD